MSEIDSKVYAEILAVGDELCYGRVYDTNSYWIADQITRLGVFVRRITCVRDDLGEIFSVFNEALTRKPKFIFITGGLGPTPDDRTIEVLSKLTNRMMIIDKSVMRQAAERRNISVEEIESTPHRIKMLQTLEGAECLPNPFGFAPLTILNHKETTIIALPGPPKEMKSCFTEHLVKRIGETTRTCSIANQVFVSMYESQVTPLITQMMKQTSGIYVKFLVDKPKKDLEWPVEVIVFGEDEETCRKKYKEAIKSFKAMIHQKGGKLLEKIDETQH